MHQEQMSPRAGKGFATVRFSDKVDRCLRRPRSATTLEVADAEDRAWGLAEARRTLAIASDATFDRMLARNPLLLRVVRSTAGERIALVAYLPLNDEGAAAIVSGRLEGQSPKPDWITGPEEKPEALYIWLVVAPGTLGRSLIPIASAFRALVPDGCPIFSRAVTSHAERLNKAMGFESARFYYPEAPDWLLVALPAGELRGRAFRTHDHDDIEVRPVRSFDDLARVFAVRAATYLAEQFCLYQEEFDGNDFCASQFLGLYKDDAAACVRVRYFGDFAKLERLAVRKEYRKSRLAFRMVRAVMAHCRRKGFPRIYAHARSDLLPFWKMFGFRPVPGRPLFRFANVDYWEIVAELEEDATAIRFGIDPMVSIRPEGDWESPGPLDLSNLSRCAERQALLGEHTRRLAQ